MRKDAGTPSFLGAGFAREPGIHNHWRSGFCSVCGYGFRTAAGAASGMTMVRFAVRKMPSKQAFYDPERLLPKAHAFE
jgi:hypothetical protein